MASRTDPMVQNIAIIPNDWVANDFIACIPIIPMY